MTASLSIVNTDPELDTVISPLSPSSTPPLTETTDPASTPAESVAEKKEPVTTGVNKVDDVGAAFDDLFND